MKKTIAILLVLVIGMVGVFAATIDNTLTVGATIAPVNLMGVYTLGTPAPSSNATAWQPNFSYATSITSDTTVEVATLHTRSNNRGGYSVTMTAKPLSSTTGEEGNTVTTYLGYKIEAFENNTSAGSSTVASYQSGNGNAATIINVAPFTTAIVTESRDLSVTIADIYSAPAGVYSGDIIFGFTAN